MQIVPSTDIHAALRYRRRRARAEEQHEVWRTVGMLGSGAAAMAVGASPETPVYSPLDEGSCVFFFDAEHADTATGTFRQLATSTVWSQATGTAQPTLITTFGGSSRALSFDGGDYIYDTTDSGVWGALVGTWPPFTFFSLHQLGALDAQRLMLSTGNSGSAQSMASFGQGPISTGRYLYNRKSDAGVTTPWDELPTVDITNPHTVEMHSLEASGQVFQRLDGGTEVSETQGAMGAVTGTNRNAVGVRAGNILAEWMLGSIRAMALYSVDLNAAASTRVRNWMMTH